MKRRKVKKRVPKAVSNYIDRNYRKVVQQYGKSVVEAAIHEFAKSSAEVCIEQIYGISTDHVKQHRHLVDDLNGHYSKIEQLLSHDIYNGRIKTNTLNQLEEAIESEIEVSNQIAQTGVFTTLSERKVEDEELITSLRKNNEDIDPNEYASEWQIPGFFFFNDWTVFAIGRVNEIREHQHQNLKRLVADLESVFSQYGAKTTQFYFRDLFESVGETDTTNFLSSGAFGIEETLNGFRSAMDAYGTIYSNNLESVAKLLPSDNMGKREFTIFVSQRLGQFIGNDKKPYIKSLEYLLKRCDEDIRYAVLEMISENTKTLELYRRLQKYRLTADSFVNFLEYGMNQSLPDDRNAFDFLVEISGVPRLAPLAVALMDTDFAWYSDPNILSLVQLANTRQDYQVIAQRYLAYSDNGEENKKSILMSLSGQENYAGMKSVFSILDGLDDENLDQIATESNPSKLLKSIKEITPTPTTIPKKQRKNKSFLESIGGLVDGETYSLIRQAYSVLQGAGNEQAKYENRLRYLWMNNPAVIPQFATHAVKYSTNQNFQLLLSNHALFMGYLGRLSVETSETFPKEFDEVMQASFGNSFIRLHNFLLPEETYLEHESEPIATELDIESIQGYERVIIYGGRFSTPIKERLTEASQLPLVINDLYSKGDILPRKDDLVICLSNPNSHTAYWRIKNYCKRHKNEGVKFLHFNQRGFEPLIGFIRDSIRAN